MHSIAKQIINLIFGNRTVSIIVATYKVLIAVIAGYFRAAKKMSKANNILRTKIVEGEACNLFINIF